MALINKCPCLLQILETFHSNFLWWILHFHSPNSMKMRWWWCPNNLSNKIEINKKNKTIKITIIFWIKIFHLNSFNSKTWILKWCQILISQIYLKCNILIMIGWNRMIIWKKSWMQLKRIKQLIKVLKHKFSNNNNKENSNKNQRSIFMI